MTTKKYYFPLFIIFLFIGFTKANAQDNIQKGIRFQIVKYNNPDAVVELGVGLCFLPMPVDYNNDGLLDILVTAEQDVSDGYTYFFENTGRKKDGIDVFKPPIRFGPKNEFFTPPYVNGRLRVLGFNCEYNLQNLKEAWKICPTKNIYPTLGAEIMLKRVGFEVIKLNPTRLNDDISVGSMVSNFESKNLKDKIQHSMANPHFKFPIELDIKQVDLIFFGSFANHDQSYHDFLRCYADQIPSFVKKGGIVVEMAQWARYSFLHPVFYRKG